MKLISVKQCSIHVSRARYIVEKNLKNYTFISTCLFRSCPLVRRKNLDLNLLTSGQP